MWRAHYLLRHHEIIVLGSIDSFLALNWSYAVLGLVYSTDVAYLSNTADTCWHLIILASELLDISGSIWIFPRNLRTVTLKSNHTSTNSHNGILLCSITKVATGIRLLCNLTTINHGVVWMTLVSESPTHHISLLNLTLNHAVCNVATHNNIVFLNHSNSTVHGILAILIQLLLSLLLGARLVTMILLSLDNVASKHLGILYFDLGVIENVVIIVDIFNDLDGLVLAFLLRLWWATPSLMGSMDARMTTGLLEACMTHLWSLTSLGRCKVIRMRVCVVLWTLMPLVSRQVTISI